MIPEQHQIDAALTDARAALATSTEWETNNEENDHHGGFSVWDECAMQNAY